MARSRERTALGVLAVAAAAFFTGNGVLIPLSPVYVVEELGRGTGSVGVMALLTAVGAIVSRVLAGALLSRRTVGPVMVGSAVAAVSCYLAIGLAGSWVVLLVATPVIGAAVALFHTSTFLSTGYNAGEWGRQRALNLISVPIFFGASAGPVLGDVIHRSMGPAGGWYVAAAAGVAAIVLCGVLCLPGIRGQEPEAVTVASPPRIGSLERRALLPGAVFVLVLLGHAGVVSYLPLYGPTIGLASTGTVFMVYAVTVPVVRLLGASTFARWGPVRVVTLGLVVNLVGCGVGLVPQGWAVYVCFAAQGIAIGMVYTTLMGMAQDRVPPHREGLAVSTYGLSYDLGGTVAAPAAGFLIVLLGGYWAMFGLGTVAALAAVGLFARWTHGTAARG